MEKFKLQLEARENRKPNQLRRAGKVPATVYGPGEASANVQVDAKEFSRLPAAAYSHIVELQSKSGNVNALIRHVQRKHTSHEVLNIEFYRVAADRKLTVTVPLKFVGTSPAVLAGGQFQPNYDAAELECLPGDIPDVIEVDISTIVEVDHGVHFADLKPSDKYKILNPAEEIVCRVVAPRSEPTPQEAATATAAAPAPATT